MVYVVGFFAGEHHWRTRMDELHYLSMYDGGVGDITLEDQVQRMRERLAGLLASPNLYVKARRLIAPFGLDVAQITEELERLDTDVEPVDRELVTMTSPQVGTMS